MENGLEKKENEVVRQAQADENSGENLWNSSDIKITTKLQNHQHLVQPEI